MKRIVEFPFEDGTAIFVEVEDPEPTDDRIGLGGSGAEIGRKELLPGDRDHRTRRQCYHQESAEPE